MVSFSDNPQEYNDTKILQQLDGQIKSSIQLAQKLRSMDQDISSSTQYLQKTAAPERHGRWDMDEFEMGGGGPPGFRGGPGIGGFPGRKGRKGMGVAN